jgi:ankyrin repeat protein
MMACRYDHPEIAKLLIEKGADIHAMNYKGWTPFMYAAYGGNDITAIKLLDMGVDVHKTSKDGWTSLMLASYGGNDILAVKLIELGVDVHQRSNDGWTALLAASYGGCTMVFKKLLDLGANVHAGNNDCNTPLMLAAWAGYLEIAKLSIDAGVDVNRINLNSRTAVYFAAYNDQYQMMRYLIKVGANTSITKIDLYDYYVLANIHKVSAEDFKRVGLMDRAINNYKKAAQYYNEAAEHYIMKIDSNYPFTGLGSLAVFYIITNVIDEGYSKLMTRKEKSLIGHSLGLSSDQIKTDDIKAHFKFMSDKCERYEEECYTAIQNLEITTY